MSDKRNLGVVVIGRNEGERLKACINSVTIASDFVIYVDSGSTDGSAGWAGRQPKVTLIDLDMSQPFTAARARNAGLRHLIELAPDIKHVQFVDGDCEVVSGWLQPARGFLEAHPNIAVVCGRRRERYPDFSIYNQICDIEWDTPIGQAKYCGGDALFRVEVLTEAKGYRSDLIAGEEPELCVRIRALGWEVWRIDQEMTLHDAHIERFSEWFKRAKRCGYAYASGFSIHGLSAERFRLKEVIRILFWGGAFPVVVVLLALFSPIWLVLLLAYPAQVLRLSLTQKRRKIGSLSTCCKWACLTVLGKFPELLGILRFLFDVLRRKPGTIIEYK